jgi:rRNA maturation endonuclease Nob1
MTTCGNCQTKNPDDAKWRSRCGEALSIVEIPINAATCPRCGKRVPNLYRCEECGVVIDKKIGRG